MTSMLTKAAVVGLTTFGLAAALATQASSAVVVNSKDPISFGAFVPCVPEVILGDGFLHTLITEEFDASGGGHFKVHYQPQGLKAIGQSTGNRYNAVGVTQEHTNFHNSGAFEDTFVNNFRMIGQGKAANYQVHQTFHVTVNANGTVTAVVDNTNVTCE